MVQISSAAGARLARTARLVVALMVTSGTVAAGAAPAMATVSLDPGVYPFSAASPWNTPVGRDATFESASGAMTANLIAQKAPAVNYDNWSVAVFQASDSDPWVTLSVGRDGYPKKDLTVQVPANTQATAGSDRHVSIVSPDRTTVYDMYKMVKVSDTQWTAQVGYVTSLDGSATGAGTRAAAVPAMAGLIRTQELASSSINHAVALALKNTQLKSGYVWPAASQDSYSADYSGQIPMGTLFAIPPTVDVSTLGLSTEGLALARALQGYGAYVVDQAGSDPLYCELTCPATSVSHLRTDWATLIGYLRAVTNNSPSSVGGGGVPGNTTTTNQPPTAAFSATASGRTVALDASASSDDKAIASYAWSFGDGQTATGRQVTHTYVGTGSFPVTLTVTDGAGATATTSQQVVSTNVAPVASFTSASSRFTAALTSTASDSDGQISAVAWAFGDGATGSGDQVSHVYASAGTYTVTMTVTDNDGASTATSSPVVIAPAAPVAAFDAAVVPTSGMLTVDASPTTDADSPLGSYSWTFGDGTTGTGLVAGHTYATSGAYTVTLKVVDADGLVGTTQRQVAVNAAPTASFTSSVSRLNASMTSTSTDRDGSIASVTWDFGDGTTGTGATTSHHYAAPGTYAVTMTAADNGGATASTTQQVVVAPKAPVAAFTTAATTDTTGLVVDASSTTDADSPIAGYAWDFGDGTSASGLAVTHVYAASGAYTVTLTVTDADGLTGVVERAVNVQGYQVLADDGFNRAVSSGWGTADAGGLWTVSAPKSTAVTGGTGSMTLAGANAAVSARLAGVSTTSALTSTTLTFDKLSNGAGTYALVRGRVTPDGKDYRVKVWVRPDGTTLAYLMSTTSTGDEKVLQGPVTLPSKLVAGGSVNVVFSVTGVSPTLLQAKVWATGQEAPTSWTLSAKDSTSYLQQQGGVGVYTRLGSGVTTGSATVRVDAIKVSMPS